MILIREPRGKMRMLIVNQTSRFMLIMKGDFFSTEIKDSFYFYFNHRMSRCNAQCGSQKNIIFCCLEGY